MSSAPSSRSLPLRRPWGWLLGAAAILQAVLLGYRHLTGIDPIPNLATLGVSLLAGTILATIAGAALVFPDLRLIRRLDGLYPWGERTLRRIAAQVAIGTLVALAVSCGMTLLSEAVFGYDEPLGRVLLRNGMIFSVVNLLLMAILEGLLLFHARIPAAPPPPTIDLDTLIGVLKEPQPEYKKRFLVRIAEKFRKVETEEIAYFFALDKSVFFRTLAGQTYPLDETLDGVEQVLDPVQFFRINRKYLVNVNAISTMTVWSKRRIKVGLTPAADDPAEAIVSMERYADFKRWLDR